MLRKYVLELLLFCTNLLDAQFHRSGDALRQLYSFHFLFLVPLVSPVVSFLTHLFHSYLDRRSYDLFLGLVAVRVIELFSEDERQVNDEGPMEVLLLPYALE